MASRNLGNRIQDILGLVSIHKNIKVNRVTLDANERANAISVEAKNIIDIAKFAFELSIFHGITHSFVEEVDGAVRLSFAVKTDDSFHWNGVALH